MRTTGSSGTSETGLSDALGSAVLGRCRGVLGGAEGYGCTTMECTCW